ncbi:glycosyltransferase family 87 protein [Devosia beringensis]|uniref:glycosyltransferase family 87 protein n=1 Tax=Devosia beringensis TaxID=2657486 RepID=UPI00186B7D9B|nr:glycosyltransferase family 87 protein [Devosia beringensis]
MVFLIAQVLAMCGGSFLLWRLALANVPSRFFWAVAWAISVCMALAIFMFIQPGKLFDDFAPVYWEAGRAVMSGPDQLLPLLRLGVDGGFVNLPIVAYIFVPFALLSSELAGWLFMAIGVAAIAYAWWLAGDLFGLSRPERGISLFVTASFGPLWYSVREGNSSHFVLLTLLMAIAALRNNQDFRAGLLLGISAIVKPPLLLLCVYAAIRLRWSIVLGAGLVLGVCAVASVAVFGWNTNLVWYETNIGTFSREPIAAINSHSIASTLARLHHGVDVLGAWEPVAVPSAIKLVGLLATAALGLVAIWAAAPWQRWMVGVAAFEADFVLIVALVLFISTLTWTHYYSWLLIPAVWAWAQIRDADYPRDPMLALGGAILLSALAYVQWRPLPGIDPLLPWLFSYLLVAGLVLFGILIWARRRIAGSTRQSQRELGGSGHSGAA